MSTWKKVELRIAELIGGKRVPVSGRARGDAPDVSHEAFSVEIKHRKTLPDWLYDAMRQAQASKRGDQLPIVILHGKQMQYQDSMVLIRLDDFMDWYGGGTDE